MTGEDSHVIAAKYDASIEQSAFNSVKEITSQNINHLDIGVTNAGISKSYPLVKDVKRAEIIEHIEVNVLSVVSLYQASRDLLQNLTKNPVYAVMGSSAGTLG